MEEELYENKRKIRNLSEKKRRDQFNVLLSDLSSLVCKNGRKVDKSSVLKSTIAFLKNHKETAVRSRVHDIQEEWKPAFISNEEFMHLILDALDSFIMVFSATGHINFVSESVYSLLGHVASDIMNKSIFDLAYDEDRPRLYNLLQNPGTSVDSKQVTVLKENQIKFQCHVRRGTLDRREEPAYELVQFIGYFRSNEAPSNDEAQASSKYNGSLLFVCTGRLQLPQLIRDISPYTSEQCEFTSRHSLEWKFLFLDHRAPSIIGYMPFEVLGTSGYDYYHLDDLDKVATCHEALMQKGELTSCHYRFLTKGQQWIWLQTRFYITYHQWNSKPEFVVCTHRVVRYADIIKPGKSMKKTNTEDHSMKEESLTEPDVSMGDVSPSYVSESLDDLPTQLHGTPHSSRHTMSTASVGGNCSDGSSAPLGARTTIVKSTRSGQSSTASVSSGCEDSSWTRATRLRYSDSDSRSGLSTNSVIRRRALHNADRTPISDNLVNAQFMELSLSPYVVSVQSVLVVQMQLQEHLQRKQEELQQVIVRQQEELRRVTEQLVMARLGLLPPMINMQYAENMILNGVGPPQIMYEVQPSHVDTVSQPLANLPSLSSSTLAARPLAHMSMSASPLSASALLPSTLHMEALSRTPQTDVQQIPQTEMPSGQFIQVSPLTPRSETPQLPLKLQYQTSQLPLALQIPQTLIMPQLLPSQISPRPQKPRLVQTVPLSQTLQEPHTSPLPQSLQVPRMSPRLHASRPPPSSQMPQITQLLPSAHSPRPHMSTQSLQVKPNITQQTHLSPTTPISTDETVPQPVTSTSTAITSTVTSVTSDSTEANSSHTTVNVTYYY